MSQSLIIYIPKISARHEYVFKLIFSYIYQISYELTTEIDYYRESKKNRINYSNIKIVDNEFFIDSNNLLDKKGVSEVEINVKNNGIFPCFFTSNNSESYEFDIFAASFYLVSRYEEYLPHLKDKYNRYKYLLDKMFQYLGTFHSIQNQSSH